MTEQEPTQEQIKELWEWCGIGKAYWLNEAKKLTGMDFDGIDDWMPVLDLNNLFKYAIPKLMIEYHNWRSVLHDWIDGLTGDYEKDALSLYWLLAQTML